MNRTISIGIDLVKGASFAAGLKALDIVVGSLEGIAEAGKDAAAQSVKLAASFQDTTNAMTVFAGSARIAKQELAAIDEAARNTPGLRLESAEKGYAQLRALGFQAETTKKLIVGLGKEKLLSPLADESAIQRVILNLTQLSAGSNRVSQDIKEIIHALPSMRSAFQDAFGTLDTKKIKTLFENNPDKAIEQLADAMARAKTPAAGLNSSLGKLYDAGIEIGRAFGEPLLEPLTNDVRDLTAYLNENKDTFTSWGQSVADALTGVSDAARGLSQLDSILGLTPNQSKALSDFTNKVNPLLRRAAFAAGTGGGSEIFQGFSYLGEQQRLVEEQRKNKKAETVSFGNIDRTSLKTFLDPKTNTLRFESENEKAARLAKITSTQTEAQQKELLNSLKSLRSEQLAVSENYYKIEQAQLSAHLDYTTEQEINSLKSISNSRANDLRSQIGTVKSYYSDLLKFGDLSKEETVKAERERNIELAKLNGELKTNEFRTQRDILEGERKIQDERREALIQFKNLQIRETQFAFDSKSFDVSRFIDSGFVSANEGYGKLKQLTQSSYEEISRITLESYQTQLQNLSLSNEQRLNLTTELYLAEKDLAEKNRQSISQIENKAFDEQIQRLENYRQKSAATYQSLGQTYQSIQNAFFNPSTFSNSTTGTLQNVLLKQSEIDKLKEYIQSGKNAENKIKDSLQLPNLSLPESAILTDALNAAIDKTIEYKGALTSLERTIPSAFSEFEQLSKEIGQGNVEAFDRAGKKILEYRQKLAQSDASAEIDHISDLIKIENIRAKAAGQAADLTELNFRKAQALRAKERLDIDQAAESVERYQNSLEGLRETLDRYSQGDTVGLKYEAQRQLLSEQKGIYQDIANLQERIVSGGVSDSLEIQAAHLRDILGLRNRELESVISINRSQLELSQKGVFSQVQSDAKVFDFLNQNIKSVTDTFADFRIGLAGTYLDAVTSPFDALSKKLEGLNPIVRGLAETFLGLGRDIVKAFSSKFILQLLGLGGGGSSAGGQQSGGQGGGILGGIVNSIRGLFGGGSASAPGGTPNFNPDLLNFGGGGIGEGLATRPRIFDPISAIGANTRGIGAGQGSLFSSASGGSSRLLGALGFAGLGASLGTGLGSGSLAGQIAGGVGVGALGLLGGVALPSILAGTFEGLTALGFATLGIGAAAIPLALILSRNAKRKKEEKLRTEYLQTSFKGLEGYDKIIADVKALRIDGATGISQGESLGSTIRAQYLEQANALKDKKTRNIAIKDVSRIDAIIKTKLDKLREVADVANSAGLRANRIIPEFANGMFFGRDDQMRDIFKSLDSRRGYINGGRLGVDRHLGLFADGEAILNRQHQLNINRAAGFDVMAKAGVPNYPKGNASRQYADGNRFGSVTTTQTAPIMNFNGNIILEGFTAEPGARAYLETSDGQKKIIGIVNKARSNREI